RNPGPDRQALRPLDRTGSQAIASARPCRTMSAVFPGISGMLGPRTAESGDCSLGQNRQPSRDVLSPDQWSKVSESLDLSRRQFEIAQCVFDDLKETAISQRLGVSPHTVHTHLERLYAKLGVHGR